MKLVKIHGTSGSGKTTLVKAIMTKATNVEAIPNAKGKVIAYKLDLPEVDEPVYVLGSYENVCGGCDTISKTADLIDLIHSCASYGHVIYEGLLISTYYGALGKAVERYGPNHIWAFLDTPIEVCIERVKQRRLDAGNTKPLNESNTRDRVRTIERLKGRVEDMSHRVEDLSYQDILNSEKVIGWLK